MVIIMFVTFALAAIAAARAAFSGSDNPSSLVLPGYQVYAEKPRRPGLEELTR